MRSDKLRPLSYARFDVGHTIGGWEVTDSDGRPVSEAFPDPSIASTVKDTLNKAAASGHRTLARALGAIDDADLVLP